MGFFKRKERRQEEPARLDWQLMERGAIALYHRPQTLARDAAWLRQHDYRVLELDAARWSTPAEFHADAQRVLGFPEHCAKNLMGWLDCLAELDVPDEGGVALEFRQFDRFARAQPQLAQTVLDSIESTSRRFLLTGRRFIALVQSDDPRIRFERVGALPVTWNPREWSEADRGLGDTMKGNPA
jgi:hypothetical protein